MKICFIDPPSSAFDDDQFFNIDDKALNRDDGLLPYFHLKKDLEKKGFKVVTFNKHHQFSSEELKNSLYISFSRKRDLNFLNELGLNLFAYYLMEPPLIDPKMYEQLPELTSNFSHVFIHNLVGDCYSLQNVDQSKLRKFYWPQPTKEVSTLHWEKTQRLSSVVVINGHHKPFGFEGKELYSERIFWAKRLSAFLPVDLYGRGWMKKVTRNNLWLVYLLNYFFIKKIYKGSCESKKETLSNYKFALCFENLAMKGYITEKIFDCFYSGTIPIYWGGNDIEDWIPKDTYIKISDFKNAKTLSHYLLHLSEEEINQYKVNAKNFLSDQKNESYFNIYHGLGQYLENNQSE